MTNILIGKFGKVISFNAEKWGMTGGDSESAILIKVDFQEQGITTIIMITKNILM